MTALALSLALTFAGCATNVIGARAIQPSNAVDTPDVWIYMQTNDAEKDGVYRCYDNGRNPVCERARMDFRR
jgi:hypothetical protein